LKGAAVADDKTRETADQPIVASRIDFEYIMDLL
jgi:hypothetical protein